MSPGSCALHVHRVLMHARRVAIGIDEADARAHAGEHAVGVARDRRQARRERVVDRGDRDVDVLLQRRRLRVADRALHTGRPRRPEQPVAAADDGLLVQAVGDAEARRPLTVGGMPTDSFAPF